MSLIVSCRPSFRNHWNEAFWMSIRLGRTRTCLRREKLVRARGAATMVVKRCSLPYSEKENVKIRTGEDARRRRDPLRYPKRLSHRKERPAGSPHRAEV